MAEQSGGTSANASNKSNASQAGQNEVNKEDIAELSKQFDNSLQEMQAESKKELEKADSRQYKIEIAVLSFSGFILLLFFVFICTQIVYLIRINDVKTSAITVLVLLIGFLMLLISALFLFYKEVKKSKSYGNDNFRLAWAILALSGAGLIVAALLKLPHTAF